MNHSWNIKRLGDICTSELGKTRDEKRNKGSFRPYLCAVNVQWDKFELSELKEMRFEDNEYDRYTIRKGDLVICEGGDIGRAAIWDKDEPIHYQNALHRVRFNEGVDSRFILYYLYFLKQTGILDGRYGKGVTIKHLVKSSLLSIPVPVPPIDEQQRIVFELDLLTDIIDKKNAQLRDLDALAQSIFYEMFGDPITNEKGWPVRFLEEIASSQIGLTYKPENVSETGTIVLRSSNIQNSIIDLNEIVRVNCDIKEKQFVREGDILMCSRNGSFRLVGKVAKIQNLPERMSYGAFMTTIRSDYNDYLFGFFKTPAFRAQLGLAKTATINQITVKMLNAIQLPVPPKDIQSSFAERIAHITSQQNAIIESLKGIQHLFNSRMSLYFG